jgi:hypothetical protein
MTVDTVMGGVQDRIVALKRAIHNLYLARIETPNNVYWELSAVRNAEEDLTEYVRTWVADSATLKGA